MSCQFDNVPNDDKQGEPEMQVVLNEGVIKGISVNSVSESFLPIRTMSNTMTGIWLCLKETLISVSAGTFTLKIL